MAGDSSPDWLRNFQSPLKDFEMISSSSTSTSSIQQEQARDPERIELSEDVLLGPEQERPTAKSALKMEEDVESNDGTDFLRLLTGNSPKEDDVVAPEDDTKEVPERKSKRVLSTLPLMLGDKVHRSKILLECEGDSLDLSGDVGAVGRFSIPESDNDEFLLDLKGILYRGSIVPSNTFFVVNIGQTEARVEAIMNDFVQLQPSSNVFETETMVEGTLDDFKFESDDENVNLPVAADATKVGENDKDTKKHMKQKEKSNQFLIQKSLKGSTKKISKTKVVSKTGSTRKTTKKANSQKQSAK